MTTVAKNALEVFDPAKLKISHSDYAGKTPTEARRAIKTLLEDYNVVIATESIDKAKITPYLQGEDFPDYIQSYGQMEGVTWVRAYYDGSDNTGIIKNGHPVVMDTVKGNAVTGINSKWAADEYKVVGVALQDYSTSGVEDKRIQVRLVTPTSPAVNYNDYGIVLLNSTINACEWTANRPINDITPIEFPEGTGIVYVPKKFSSGKYGYAQLPGIQKVINYLPFFIPYTAPGPGAYYVTYLDGAWLIKQPVDRNFRWGVTAQSGQPLLAGVDVKWNDSNGNGSGFGIAELQASGGQIHPILKGQIFCRIEAQVIIDGSGGLGGGSNEDIVWRSDMALQGLSATGNGATFSSQTVRLEGSLGGPVVTGELFAGLLVTTHHFWWEGWLGIAYSSPIYMRSLWFNGVNPTIRSGELVITPLHYKP